MKIKENSRLISLIIILIIILLNPVFVLNTKIDLETNNSSNFNQQLQKKGHLPSTISKLYQSFNPEFGEDIFKIDKNISSIESLAISPDGKVFASVDSYGIKLWNLTTATLLATLQNSPGLITFSPNNKFIAISNRSRINIWDLETQIITQTIEISDKEFLHSISFSQDGSFLVADIEDLNQDKHKLIYWETNTWSENFLASLGTQFDILEFSPTTGHLVVKFSGIT